MARETLVEEVMEVGEEQSLEGWKKRCRREANGTGRDVLGQESVFEVPKNLMMRNPDN